jgi:hypothetical protein
MSAEDEIMDILGRRLTPSLYVQARIEAKCTELVKIVAMELAAFDNQCLGDHSQINCHATLIA